jgi:hypothetical protein
VGPSTGIDELAERKIPSLNLGRPGRSIVTILTELLRLLLMVGKHRMFAV